MRESRVQKIIQPSGGSEYVDMIPGTRFVASELVVKPRVVLVDAAGEEGASAAKPILEVMPEARWT